MQITTKRSNVKRFQRETKVYLKCTFCKRKIKRLILKQNVDKTVAFCADCNPHQLKNELTNKTAGCEKSYEKLLLGGR